MTSINLSQIATSLVAALVASTLFISAAVGPAAQFIGSAGSPDTETSNLKDRT
jgi:hypothetical protein